MLIITKSRKERRAEDLNVHIREEESALQDKVRGILGRPSNRNITEYPSLGSEYWQRREELSRVEAELKGGE